MAIYQTGPYIDYYGTEDLIGTGTIGNDYIWSGYGNDTLSGLAGNDTLKGYYGNDIIYGGDDNDTLEGEVGNDTLYGDAGNDSLDGGDGNDSLYGGIGTDTLKGSSGNDILDGGLGIDIADYSNLGTAVTLQAYGQLQKGTLGTDTLVGIETIIGAIGQTNTIDGSASGTLATMDVNLSTNTLEIKGLPAPLQFTVQNFTDVIGSSQNDLIIGDSANNTIRAGAGNDYLDGQAGNDYLDGQAGNDIIYGEAGNDTIYGEAGNDVLNGGDGIDSLYGEDGNDSLDGGSGNDVMMGGRGDDLYYVDAIGDSITEYLGAGTDTVITTVNGYSLTNNIENLTLAGTAYSGYGNLLDNSMTGTSSVNYLFGGDGNDSLYGLGGDDSLDGDTGNDYLHGGDGSDYLDGWTGDDSLNGGAGNDTLLGYNGNDKLQGGLGSDYLDGEAGNDVLVGGAGTDCLTGGAGDDRFVFYYLGDGVDTITDFNWDTFSNPGLGRDFIEISKAGFGATSLGQFSYDSGSGKLFFDASPFDAIGPSHFATLQNKPAEFAVSLDLLLV